MHEKVSNLSMWGMEMTWAPFGRAKVALFSCFIFFSLVPFSLILSEPIFLALMDRPQT